MAKQVIFADRLYVAIMQKNCLENSAFLLFLNGMELSILELTFTYLLFQELLFISGFFPF